MSEIKLLKIDDFDKEAKPTHFYANTICNHLLRHHSRIEKHHRHDFFALFLFTSGAGTHTIDFNSYEIKPGAVFFLYPDQTHRWELSEDADGLLIFHNIEYYEMGNVYNNLHDYRFFESSQTEKCFYLNEEETHRLTEILNFILQEHQNDLWKKKQLINSYLTQAYILLQRWIENKSSFHFLSFKNYTTIFTAFEKVLDQNFQSIRSAGNYAEKLHISQKHLNRIVKSITGKTTSQMISERLLLEAKRKLVFTELSIQEIAHELMFEDTSYFVKYFKKSVGVTPKKFRDENVN